MSLRLKATKGKILIGVAALSIAGAGWTVYSVLSDDGSYEIAPSKGISVARSDAAMPPRAILNSYAARMFAQTGKQDRADFMSRVVLNAADDRPGNPQAPETAAGAKPEGKQFPIIAASFTPAEMIRGGPTRFAGSMRQGVNRSSKSDPIEMPDVIAKTRQAKIERPRVKDEELKGPGMSAAMFMLTPHSGWDEASAQEETVEIETETKTGAAGGIAPVEAKPAGRASWSDLIKLARMTGGDGEKIEEGIFGNLTEREFRAREFRCMATAIYFEARGESIEGQIAVAQVIMTRVRSDYYPNTICGVVFQGQWNRNACQFSFACDGLPEKPKSTKQWDTAIDVAKRVISGQAYLKDIGEATHYHATYVSPKWRKQMKRVKKLGVHIFYKAPFVRPIVASTDLEDIEDF